MAQKWKFWTNSMLRFKYYILESGAPAGTHELGRTSVDKARKLAESLFSKYGRDLDKELPDFNENYAVVQGKAALGHTKRKEMPVINRNDVIAFQKALKDGSIDLTNPWAKQTKSSNPFPEGLSGQDAELFLKKGLKIYDNDQNDDRVKVRRAKVDVYKLLPIQEQIYIDKSLEQLAKGGVATARKFHTSQTTYIASSDYRIVDGHHRFFSASLIDEHMKVNALVVDLPIETLLPLSLAFGDARGNKRNA